jgi:hypothetical protein
MGMATRLVRGQISPLRPTRWASGRDDKTESAWASGRGKRGHSTFSGREKYLFIFWFLLNIRGSGNVYTKGWDRLRQTAQPQV